MVLARFLVHHGANDIFPGYIKLSAAQREAEMVSTGDTEVLIASQFWGIFIWNWTSSLCSIFNSCYLATHSRCKHFYGRMHSKEATNIITSIILYRLVHQSSPMRQSTSFPYSSARFLWTYLLKDGLIYLLISLCPSSLLSLSPFSFPNSFLSDSHVENVTFSFACQAKKALGFSSVVCPEE